MIVNIETTESKKSGPKHRPTSSQLTYNDSGDVFLNAGLEKTDAKYVKIPLSSELVRIDYDLLHFGLFKYAFRSLDMQTTNRVNINYNNRVFLELVNPSCNFDDAINMLSIVKLVQERMIKGRSVEIRHSDIGHFYIFEISERELRSYLGKGDSTKSRQDTHESIMHLKEITAHLTVYEKNAFSTIEEQKDLNLPIKTKSGNLRYHRSFGFIVDYENNNLKGRGAKVKITLDGMFLDMCFTKKESLNVRHKELQGISQAEQGIMLYLGGQRRNYIPLKRLQKYFRIIHPSAPTNTREKRQYAQNMNIYNEQVRTFKKRVKDALASLKKRMIIEEYEAYFHDILDPTTLRGFKIIRKSKSSIKQIENAEFIQVVESEQSPCSKDCFNCEFEDSCSIFE
jgi:hypothetical protein